MEAQLGVSNIFALLGVSFKGRRGGRAETAQTDQRTEEIVHTPASLFSRLRQELWSMLLVRELDLPKEGFASIRPGDFVEFQATLRKSPLVDVLRNFSELIVVIEGLGLELSTEPSTNGVPPRRGQNKNVLRKPETELQKVKRQIDAILQAVTAAGSQDFIAESNLGRLVLTAEDGYFVDPSMNDVIDGTFRIFGKVTRVIKGPSEEGISLLRKTALSRATAIGQQLVTNLNSIQGSGLEVGSVETEIPGPTLQVIPIAIFA